MSRSILVIEDDSAVLQLLQRYLRQQRWETYTASHGEDGLRLYDTHQPDVVLLDLNLPGLSGELVLDVLVAREAAVVVQTAQAEIEVAVRAMQAGAESFVTKPYELAKLDAALERAAAKIELRRSFRRHGHRTGAGGRSEALGSSAGMMDLEHQVNLLAQTESTALLLGESGTGKTFVAELIHARSHRAREPFIDVNCAGLQATFMDSELFGHERGAFTDAKEMRRGLFELAHRGTLFLDEVGDLPLELQPKLLKVLETSTFRRLGGTRQHSIDVRLIAATNRDLEGEVKAGRFRRDLYYRLAVFPLLVPPLRQRSREDVVALVSRLWTEIAARKRSGPPARLSDPTLAALAGYHWPGNVRELRNVLERALVLAADAPMIERHHLPASITVPRRDRPHDVDILPLQEVERLHIVRTLALVRGNRSSAAVKLGISRSTLHAKINQYAISEK